MSASQGRWPDLTRAREALAVYDAGQAERDAMLNTAVESEAAGDTSDYHRWLGAVRRAADKVRDALYLDTADRNSRAHCDAVDCDDVRRMVQKWEAQTRNDEEAGHVR